MMPTHDLRQTAYTAAEVRRLVPVSARQLQWWDEAGIVKPAHQHHRRLYRPAELLDVLLIHELKMRGFSLQQIRGVRKALRKQGFELPGERQRWLLTNGERVVLLAHPDVVIAFLEQRRSPAYVLLSLEALARKVEEGRVRFRKTEMMPAKREPQSAGLAAFEGFEERRA